MRDCQGFLEPIVIRATLGTIHWACTQNCLSMKVDMNSNQRTVTVEGQITVELVSSLARLDLKICCYIYAVKQLKLETSRAVILPPTVSVLCSNSRAKFRSLFTILTVQLVSDGKSQMDPDSKSSVHSRNVCYGSPGGCHTWKIFDRTLALVLLNFGEI